MIEMFLETKFTEKSRLLNYLVDYYEGVIMPLDMDISFLE